MAAYVQVLHLTKLIGSTIVERLAEASRQGISSIYRALLLHGRDGVKDLHPVPSVGA